MPKKILILTSTWDGEYNRSIIAGITERIGDDDVELHIFNSYDTALEADYYRKGREIYQLPAPENYDGMIIALSTLETVRYVDEINAKFHAAQKPVVSIDIHAENAIFCGLDNYRSMYQMVEHMITIHDCRIFNYLGGPEENDEAAERFRAFCDCLASHGIKVEKKRVLHKKFWKTDGKDAYKEWKERGVGMADAVVCANDFMALGYVEAATDDGISVPDYIKVVGFDNIDEAQRYYPSITSVNRNRKALGYESMDALYEAMEGNTEFDTRFVEGYINYNESCGCELMRDIRIDYNDFIEKTKDELNTARQQSYSRQVLFKCRSMDDYENALDRSTEMLELGDIALVLNRSFFDSDPDRELEGFEEDLYMYYHGEKKQIRRNEQMYPDEWKGKYKIYLFACLRNSVQTYGYSVMPYRDDLFLSMKHRAFTETLAISLQNISLRFFANKNK